MMWFLVRTCIGIAFGLHMFLAEFVYADLDSSAELYVVEVAAFLSSREMCIVKVTEKTSLVEQYSCREASFGPGLPYASSLHGRLYHVGAACNGTVKNKCTKTSEFECFALIDGDSGPCHYDQKVFNVQNALFSAAIVYSRNRPVPFQMKQIGEQNITIPSVSVGKTTAEYLLKCHPSTHYVVLEPGSSELKKLIILIVAVAVCCFLSIILLILCAYKLYQCYGNPANIEANRRKKQLKKLTIRKFKKDDPSEICAICLDDYNIGDKLRVLPCSHEYHSKCIDTWLYEDSDLCPLCKRSIFPATDVVDTETQVASSDATGSNPSNERAPLLGQPYQTAHRRNRDRAAIRRLMRRFRTQNRDVVAVAESSASSSGSEDDNESSRNTVTASIQVHRNANAPVVVSDLFNADFNVANIEGGRANASDAEDVEGDSASAAHMQQDIAQTSRTGRRNYGALTTEVLPPRRHRSRRRPRHTRQNDTDDVIATVEEA